MASANIYERNKENTIRLESAPNFREVELVGEKSKTPMLRGLLFRSGHLADLSQRDKKRVEDLGLTLICDLRSTAERNAHPSQINTLAGGKWKHFEIMPRSADEFRERIFEGTLTPEVSREIMVSVYREFVTQHSADYSKILWNINGSQQGPILIHCAAGKDRTGWAIALLLLALDIPLPAIIDDYLRSGILFPTESEIATSQIEWLERGAPPVKTEALRPFYQIDLTYLFSAFRAAEELDGSLGNYIDRTLGIDARQRANLRHRFFGRY